MSSAALHRGENGLVSAASEASSEEEWVYDSEEEEESDEEGGMFFDPELPRKARPVLAGLCWSEPPPGCPLGGAGGVAMKKVAVGASGQTEESGKRRVATKDTGFTVPEDIQRGPLLQGKVRGSDAGCPASNGGPNAAPTARSLPTNSSQPLNLTSEPSLWTAVASGMPSQVTMPLGQQPFAWGGAAVLSFSGSLTPFPTAALPSGVAPVMVGTSPATTVGMEVPTCDVVVDSIQMDTETGPELSFACEEVVAHVNASKGLSPALSDMCRAVTASMAREDPVQSMPLDADGMDTRSISEMAPDIIDQLVALRLISEQGKSLEVDDEAPAGGSRSDEARIVQGSATDSMTATATKKATIQKRRWFTKYQECQEENLADGKAAGPRKQANAAFVAPNTGSARGNVIEEIVVTERQYVEDLDNLIRFFANPLRRSIGKRKVKKSGSRIGLERRARKKEEKNMATLISPKDHELIFGDIEAIRNLHQVLLSDMEEQASRPTEEQKLGDCFILLSKCLVLYSEYCSNHPRAAQLIEKLVASSKALRSFLDYATSQPELKGLGLQAFLIKPVQRICKYPLFLRELIKCTPEDHPDLPSISLAAQEMDVSCKKINERKRDVDNMKHFLTIKARTGVSFLETGRRFIADGLIVRYRKGKGKKGRFVLFSDILVFIADGKVALKLPVSDLVVQDVPLPSWPFAVQLISKKTKCVLCPASQSEKEKFVAALHERMGAFLNKNFHSINKHLRVKAENPRRKISIDESSRTTFEITCTYGHARTCVSLLPELCIRPVLLREAARGLGLPAEGLRLSYTTETAGEVFIDTDEDFDRLAPFLETVRISL